MTVPQNTPPTTSLTTDTMAIDRKAHWEREDAYQKVILEFRESWRLIKCKNNRQYVIQQRSFKKPNVGVWIGKSHNTTKSGLILSCSRLGLLCDMDVIQRLLLLPMQPSQEARNG